VAACESCYRLVPVVEGEAAGGEEVGERIQQEPGGGAVQGGAEGKDGVHGDSSFLVYYILRTAQRFSFVIAGVIELVLLLSVGFLKFNSFFLFAVLAPDGRFLFEASKRNEKMLFHRIFPQLRGILAVGIPLMGQIRRAGDLVCSRIDGFCILRQGAGEN
jgi:hypothetical protein